MLPSEELQRVRFEKDAILFREGDAGDAAYIVDVGAIGIFKTIEGGRIHLATLKEGELFGEMAIIDGSARMAEAVAMEDSVVVKIPGDVLEAKMSEYDVFMRSLINILVNNLREVHRVYMRRPRSVQDYIAVLADHAGGLRRYLGILREMDPDADVLKVLDRLEDSIAELGTMFTDHKDRRRSVITDTDL